MLKSNSLKGLLVSVIAVWRPGRTLGVRVPPAPIPGGRVLWASNVLREIQLPKSTSGLNWSSMDETDKMVAGGAVDANGCVHLDSERFGVGFYRIAVSNGYDTTVAILRDPHPNAARWPPVDTPVGVDTAQAWETPCDMENQSAVSGLAAAAGCGWTRDRLRWVSLEPSRGTYAPLNTCYDNATRAAEAAGVRVLEVFHEIPPWAVDAATDAADGCDSSLTQMPRDLRDLYAFTSYLPTRFGKVVAAYEPWNEGNTLGFGGQTTDQRGSHQKAAYLGFKAAAVHELPFVCNNVLAGAGTNWTAVQTVGNDVAPYIQSYNVHSYQAVETYTDFFAPARLAGSATGAPIWLTECGIHLDVNTPPPWSDMTAENDRLQAQFLAPSFAVSFFSGIRVHFFFILTNYIEGTTQFGLLRHDRSPRPGYAALAAVGHFLANATSLGRVAHTPGSAVVYAHRANTGGGPARDVLVMYCSSPLLTCVVPPSVLALHMIADVYDYLGRSERNIIPQTATPAAMYIVLPQGTVGSTLRVEPPLFASGRKHQRVTQPRASSVVIQSAFPYRANLLAQDSHILNATGQDVVFYVYNFGSESINGAVNVTPSPGTNVTPTSWTNVVVAAGDRARLVARIVPPGGRAAVDENLASGVVRIVGDFEQDVNTSYYFRVTANISSLKPRKEVPCAGASIPSAWNHNVAPGGSVNVAATSTPGCVKFTDIFNANTGDAWSYPQLTFNSSSAAPSNADGIRFWVSDVGCAPPRVHIKELNVLFFTSNNDQYAAPYSASPGGNELTVLFQDSNWNHFGPLPHGSTQLRPENVSRMAIGLNLDGNNSTATMTVCDLRWVTF